MTAHTTRGRAVHDDHATTSRVSDPTGTHERAANRLLAQVPDQFRGDVDAWVAALRGVGRRPSRPVAWVTVRTYLQFALPVLQGWSHRLQQPPRDHSRRHRTGAGVPRRELAAQCAHRAALTVPRSQTRETDLHRSRPWRRRPLRAQTSTATTERQAAGLAQPDRTPPRQTRRRPGRSACPGSRRIAPPAHGGS